MSSVPPNCPKRRCTDPVSSSEPSESARARSGALGPLLGVNALLVGASSPPSSESLPRLRGGCAIPLAVVPPSSESDPVLDLEKSLFRGTKRFLTGAAPSVLVLSSSELLPRLRGALAPIFVGSACPILDAGVAFDSSRDPDSLSSE